MRRRALLTRALPGALAAPALVACAEGTGSFRSVSSRPVFGNPGRFSDLPDEPLERAGSAFWEWWGDGRAEMSGYRISTPRYGAPREGELALVYVTEPHDRRTWIKDDTVEEPHRVNVMKLNVSLKFLTGIYPYSLLTSVFAPVDRYRPRGFSPVKLTLGSQEWCGNYFHEVWPAEDQLRSLRISYFASEGETVREIRVPPDTLYEDALLIQLRELDGPFAGGGDWEGPLVPGLWSVRRRHGTVRPVPARITRERGRREGVPVTRFTVRLGEEERVIDVERERPRRVLGWRTSDGEVAALLGSERLAYWRLNGPGDEEERRRMGLDPEGRPPSTEGAEGASDPS